MRFCFLSISKLGFNSAIAYSVHRESKEGYQMNIKSIIKKIIINNNKLYVFAQCINNLNDPNYIKLIKGYYDGSYDYTSILVTRNGIRFPSIIVYHIVDCKVNNGKNIKGRMGFCAVLRWTLEKLYFSDYFGFTPIVEWGNVIPYYDTGMDIVTKNVFEYYFEPVSKINYEEIKDCGVVIEARMGHRNFSMEHASHELSYAISKSEIEKLAYIYKKYIHLNKKTREYVNENLNNLLKDNKIVLAVHVRGTDFNVGCKNHPTVITPQEYLTKVKELYASGDYDKIFLATDDENVLELFQREFKSELLYYADAFRSKNHVGAQCTYSKRPLHYYRLGLETLRDIYTLANCNSLICGPSQVAFAAQYINLALNRDFKELVILDKGINKDNSVEAKRYKRWLRNRNRAESL